MTPEHLRTLRESRGLTRDELATELGGCTAQAIVKWERGERPIPAWVEEKMLSNVEIKFPISDLHTLLDYARESGESFETFLSTAVREYLAKHRSKQAAPTPVTTGAVYQFPSDDPTLKVAEDAPPAQTTSKKRQAS
jgi:transcriptional regulator with XRE-family HTH domain